MERDKNGSTEDEPKRTDGVGKDAAVEAKDDDVIGELQTGMWGLSLWFYSYQIKSPCYTKCECESPLKSKKSYERYKKRISLRLRPHSLISNRRGAWDFQNTFRRLLNNEVTVNYSAMGKKYTDIHLKDD